MRLFIVAGDPSGDFHASNLAKKIKQLSPQIEIFSGGGKELAKTTIQIIDLEKIAVTGLFEVLSYLGRIIKAFNFIIKKIEELKPRIIVLVDFPDFNLRLAKRLKKKGYKIFYYISPQLWAWRRKRINLIKNYVDKMLVIFPFEEEFYRKYNIPVLYVGHPLIETIPPLLGEKEKEKIIAFFPGSREKEVKKHLPIFLKVKKLLQANFKFIVVKHPRLTQDLFKEAVREGLQVIEKKDFEMIGKSYLALASSGTVTLELALLRVPTIVIYKMNLLSWLVLKDMVKTDFICMVNILAKEKIFPEFIQNEASPQNLTTICKKLIEDKEFYLTIQEKLGKIRTILGEKSASLTTAQEILKEVSMGS